MSDLLAALERAEIGDRELDARLIVETCKPQQYPDDLRYYYLPSVSTDYMECAPGTYWLKQRSGASLQTAPMLTTSLDAIVSLIEMELPGWTRAVDATAPELGIDVDLFPPRESLCQRVQGTHNKEALPNIRVSQEEQGQA